VSDNMASVDAAGRPVGGGDVPVRVGARHSVRLGDRSSPPGRGLSNPVGGAILGRAASGQELSVWAYDDPQGWGKRLHEACGGRGISCRMFEAAVEPDRGYAFVHMHHHPNLRRLHKKLMQNLSVNNGLTLIPDYRSSVLYDDKLEQARHLARWMPPTKAFFTPMAAKGYLNNDEPAYPFLSKSAEGASSNNVRMINSYQEAMAEVRAAFSDRGIPMHYDLAQLGYLLWQRFIPENDHDVRVVGIGRQRLVLRRFNRTDRPMASGSRNFQSVVDADDEVRSALDYSDRFFEVERMKWAAVDMVRDETRWYILETTVGWTMGGYVDCAFFARTDGEWKPTGKVGRDAWAVLVNEIEQGTFDS